MGRKPLCPIGLVDGVGTRCFSVDEGGGLAVCTEFGDEQGQAVQDAADSCPTQAITVAN
jgi:ferredoxin